MRRIPLLLVLSCAVSASNFLNAQKNVSMDMLTGTANVTIPITTIQQGPITVPIYYYYSTGGIKVDDKDMQFGLGWHMNIDPAITRTVHGFPDDITYTPDGIHTIYGWLQGGSTLTNIETFASSLTHGIYGATPTCSNETSDYSYMNSNIPDNFDTEPDKFSISAPGLHVEFVFDKNGDIRTIPFQDLRITKSVDMNGKIIAFSIVTDKGLTYYFNQPEGVTEEVDDSPSPLIAFSRDFHLYDRHGSSNSYVAYNNKWQLTLISDANYNQVAFNYTSVTVPFIPTPDQKVDVMVYNSGTSTYNKTNIYTKSIVPAGSQYRLSNINTSAPSGVYFLPANLRLVWDGAYQGDKLDSIILGRPGGAIVPQYSGLFSGNSNGRADGRFFLMGLTSSGFGLNSTSYAFTYNNVNNTAHTSYCTFSGNDSIDYDQDYWGYFTGHNGNTDLNPKMWAYTTANKYVYKINRITGYTGTDEALLDGSDRSATTSVAAGTLATITYPTGGTTTFSYENQEYFDNDLAATVSPASLNRVKGGGVRVYAISNDDGISGSPEITYYDYQDPITHVSYGVPISIPNFAFAFPNSTSFGSPQAMAENSTYRTLYDRSDENNTIIYSKVIVRKTNGGTAVYEYNTEGTWWLDPVVMDEWQHTAINVARISPPSPCTTAAPDILKTGIYNNYPFPQNPDYDFRRGQLRKITNYDQSGNEVSEEAYAYSPSHTRSSGTNPETVIKALKFDDVSAGTGARYYAVYDVVSSVEDLLTQKVTKKFSQLSPYTDYTTETEDYTYPSTGEHRNPILITKTNSDGTVFKTYLQYVKDYSFVGVTGGDTYSLALKNLQANNDDKMIESYQTVTPAGGTEKVVSGNLNTFQSYYNTQTTFGMYLPFEGWKFASQAGVSVSGFASSVSISLAYSTFNMNSGYLKASTINDYDFGASPMSVTGSSTRSTNTVIVDPDYHIKVADFSNATSSEVSYSSFDFNNALSGAMAISGTPSFSSPGRLSQSCLVFGTGNSLTQSLTITASPPVSNFIFSCWTKDAASSGTITININSVNYTISFTTGSTWTYHEILIPASSNTITVTTSASIKIDDVLLYPEFATPRVYSYQDITITGFTGRACRAETGLNGDMKQIDYDVFGRPYIIWDGFGNMLEAKDYKLLNNW